MRGAGGWGCVGGTGAALGDLRGGSPRGGRRRGSRRGAPQPPGPARLRPGPPGGAAASPRPSRSPSPGSRRHGDRWVRSGPYEADAVGGPARAGAAPARAEAALENRGGGREAPGWRRRRPRA